MRVRHTEQNWKLKFTLITKKHHRSMLPPCATFASKQAKSHNYGHRYAQEVRPRPSRVNSVPLERPDTTLEALSARNLVKTCSISKFELGRVSGSGAIFVGKIWFWIRFGYESTSKDFCVSSMLYLPPAGVWTHESQWLLRNRILRDSHRSSRT